MQGESYRPGCPKAITLEPASQKEDLPEDLRRWVRRPLEAGVLKAVGNRLVARVATLLSSFICGSSTIRIIILPKSAVPVALAEQQFTP